MKELFLRQRPPRLLFAGSNKAPVMEIVSMLFPEAHSGHAAKVSTIHRWHDAKIADRGTISILDARTLGGLASEELSDELKRQPADLVFFLDDADGPKTRRKISLDNLVACLEANDENHPDTKVIAIFAPVPKSNSARDGQKAETNILEPKTQLAAMLASNGISSDRLRGSFQFPSPSKSDGEEVAMMSAIARELPNEARIEMGGFRGIWTCRLKLPKFWSIHHCDLHRDRSTTDSFGRSSHLDHTSAGDGLRNHVRQRARAQSARRHRICRRSRSKCWSGNASARRDSGRPEILSRLGKPDLWDGRWRRHLCDRPRCHCLLHRRSFD